MRLLRKYLVRLARIERATYSFGGCISTFVYGQYMSIGVFVVYFCALYPYTADI